MSEKDDRHLADDDCNDCAIQTGRRDFLIRSLVAAAGVAALSGFAGRASALPIERLAALKSTRNTKTYPIPAADAIQIDGDAGVILVRQADMVWAHSVKCTHQGGILAWDEGNKYFECPKHHSKFHADGSMNSNDMKAQRPLDRFPIVKDTTGPNVIVTIDAFVKQTESPDPWAAAAVKVLST